MVVLVGTLIVVSGMIAFNTCSGPGSSPSSATSPRYAAPATAAESEYGSTYDARGNRVAKKRAPSGLRGLSFGMTRAQAQAALPELADADELSPARIDPRETRITLGSDLTVELLDADIHENLPGDRLGVATTIGGYDANCELEFAVNDTLSHMVCTLVELPSYDVHMETEHAVLDVLKQKYGPPVDYKHDDLMAGMQITQGSWTWRDGRAELVVRSSYMTAATSAIALDNTWDAHARLVEELQKKANARYKAETERIRKARAEAFQKQVEENGRSLEKDL